MVCCSNRKLKTMKKKKIYPHTFENINSPTQIPISILTKHTPPQLDLSGSTKKYKKRNSIYPGSPQYLELPSKKKQIQINKKELEEKHKQQDEFHNRFISEILQCGICLEKFSLGENKIVTECAGCNKFLHCGIAGKCVGEDCSCIVDKKKESLTYCIRCVNNNLKINCENNGMCLCKKCEISKTTQKNYLRY